MVATASPCFLFVDLIHAVKLFSCLLFSRLSGFFFVRCPGLETIHTGL